MRTFILIMFWIHVVSVIFHIAKIDDTPYQKTETTGSCLMGVIVSILFAVYAGILLWS